MKSGDKFGEVMERAKEAFGVRNDAALAAVIGMSPTAFSNRKQNGSIPYDELIAAATTRNVDIGWLLTGKRTVGNTRETAGIYEISPRKQAILDMLDKLDEAGQREIQEAAEKIERMREIERKLAEISERLKVG